MECLACRLESAECLDVAKAEIVAEFTAFVEQADTAAGILCGWILKTRLLPACLALPTSSPTSLACAKQLLRLLLVKVGSPKSQDLAQVVEMTGMQIVTALLESVRALIS